MSIINKVIGSGLLFFLTIGTGVWLSSFGKPYNNAIFTVHKLIALAAVVFTAYSLFKNIDISSLTVALIIIAGVSVLALFISGALLSIGNEPYILLRIIHVIATLLAVTTMGWLVYLVGKN